MTAAIEQLSLLLSSASSAVVFTGAGISTDSGIPDFRSPGGLWSKFKPIEYGEFINSEKSR
ncbi:MAG: Sir2 family NAD-dependent protein deacetylase, partial [Gammaproteobacteria bacterium]